MNSLTSVLSYKDYRILKTASYYVALVALGLSVAIVGPTLPDLAKNTGSQISQLSYLFSARAFGFLIGAFIGGSVFDRIKGHPVIALMLLFAALCLAVVPTVSLLSILVFILLLTGMTEGMIDVGANMLIVWIYREKVGPYMNGLHFCFGVGAFIAPIVLAQVIIITNDFSYAYWILAAAIAPLALAVLFIPSPPIQIEKEEITNGKQDWLLIGSIVLFFFLWVGAEVGFGGWIFTYALKSGLTDKAGAAYLTSAFWGAFTLARLASVGMAARFKPVQILFGSLIGSFLSVFLISVQPNSFNILLLGTICVGVFMAAVFPTTLSFSERRLVLNSKITSWFLIGAGTGGMVLPWVIGQFVEVSPGLLMKILMGSIALTLLDLLWICFVLKPKILE